MSYDIGAIKNQISFQERNAPVVFLRHYPIHH